MHQRIVRIALLAVLSFFMLGLAHEARAQDPTRIVTEAYEDLLGRKPDKDGLRTYRSRIIDNGWKAQDVRQDIMKSEEYANIVVARAYDDLLGRKPDREGAALYRKRLAEQGWTEKRVREDIMKSQEYRNRQPGKKK